MRALALLLSLPLLALSGCSNERDYKVVVTWLINGLPPTPAICAEQGIASARLIVRSGGGNTRQLDAPCSQQIEVWAPEYETYVRRGGFITKASFDWETYYSYELLLVDAAGTPVSYAGTGEFQLGFDEADIYELNYLEYVEPQGRTATISGAWQVGFGDLATQCAAAGIDTVQILASSPYDVNFEQEYPVAEASCSSGALATASPTLALGLYRFRYGGYGLSGVSLAASALTEEIEISAPVHITLPPLPLLPVAR